MQELIIWFEIGLEHILSLNSWDHQLFLLCLALSHPVSQWKNTLIMLTLFTLAHSFSLIFCVLDWVQVSSQIAEPSIALTLVFSALYLLRSNKNSNKKPYLIYSGVLIFGFIHGLGFAHQLKSLLGREESVLGPLFFFNCGIEIAQVIFIGILLLFYLILKPVLKNERIVQKFRITILSLILIASCFLLFSHFIKEP